MHSLERKSDSILERNEKSIPSEQQTEQAVKVSLSEKVNIGLQDSVNLRLQEPITIKIPDEILSKLKDESFSKKDWVKLIIIPFILCIVGSYYGIYLQDRSIKKNALFKAKLDLIIATRSDTIKLVEDLDLIRRQIRSTEDDTERNLNQVTDTTQQKQARKMNANKIRAQKLIAKLKEARMRFLAIENTLKDISNSNDLQKTIENFVVKMEKFVICLEQDEFVPCSDNHDEVIDLLLQVSSAQAKMGVDLVQQID